MKPMSAMIRHLARSAGLLALVLGMAGAASALPSPPPLGTPEIDPGSIASALTLLSGGVLVLSGRRRK